MISAGFSDVVDGTVCFGSIPFTIEDIQRDTAIPLPKVRLALRELVAKGLVIDTSGSLVVPIFAEMQAKDPTRNDRQVAFRERKRNAKHNANSNAKSVTNNGTSNAPSNGQEEQSNRDTSSLRSLRSLRSAALKFEVFPEGVDDLKKLAMPFLEAFGHCIKRESVQKHGPSYVEALSIMRSRGATIEQAWAACEDALAANNGRPLWAGSIKKAVSFLKKNTRENGLFSQTNSSRLLDLSKVQD